MTQEFIHQSEGSVLIKSEVGKQILKGALEEVASIKSQWDRSMAFPTRNILFQMKQ